MHTVHALLALLLPGGCRGAHGVGDRKRDLGMRAVRRRERVSVVLLRGEDRNLREDQTSVAALGLEAAEAKQKDQ